MSSVVTRAQARYRRSPFRLPFEALLSIFSNLDSHDIVVMRRCCKRWQEIIDNNKSLWRVLEWIQQRTESPDQALEMFDNKSASTLKEVSIFQTEGESDYRFFGVLDRSNSTLTDLSLKLCSFGPTFRPKLIELASNSRHLESLVLWFSPERSLSLLPKARLTRSSRQPYLGTERSSNLQVLWCFNLMLMTEWDGKLDVSSLISFADPMSNASLKLRSFISNFSTTLVHLSINSVNDITTPSLYCPSLRILEGRFDYGFPSWIDAPRLQIVIARDIVPNFLRQLPTSVEELWLLNWYTWLTTERHLGFLSSVCPQLKIVKLGKELFEEDSDTRTLLESFRAREEKARNGVEIEGIKMRSLEKLIVPTELLEPDQLAGLREIVNEVIDIEDYPAFIELEC